MTTRLEELLAKQAKIAEQIAEVKAEEEASKIIEAIAGDMAKALLTSAKKRNVDIATLHEKCLLVKVDGESVSFEVVSKPKARKSNGNGNGKSNGNGNGNYEYKLKDGRTFSRLVDAIEAMTGQPCELKHDGKTFEDGKPKLRYSRLTEDMQTAIEQVEKASQPEEGQPEANAEATEGQPEATAEATA